MQRCPLRGSLREHWGANCTSEFVPLKARKLGFHNHALVSHWLWVPLPALHSCTEQNGAGTEEVFNEYFWNTLINIVILVLGFSLWLLLLQH